MAFKNKQVVKFVLTNLIRSIGNIIVVSVVKQFVRLALIPILINKGISMVTI